MSESKIVALKILLRIYVVAIILYIVVKLIAIVTEEVLVQEYVLEYFMLGLLFLIISVFISFPETRTLIYGYSRVGCVKYYLSQLAIYLIICSLILHYLSRILAVNLVDLRLVFWILCGIFGTIIFSDIVIKEKKVFAFKELKLRPIKALRLPRFKRLRLDSDIQLKLKTESIVLILDGDYKGVCIYGDSRLHIDSLFYSFGALPKRRLRGFTLVISRKINIPEDAEELEESEAKSYIDDSMEQVNVLNKVIKRVRELIEEEVHRRAVIAAEESDDIKVFKLWRLYAIEDRYYRLKVVNLGGLHVSEIKWIIMLRDSRAILLKHSDGYMIIKCKLGFPKKVKEDEHRS